MGQIFGPIGDLFSHIFTFPIFNVLMLFYHLFGDLGVSIIVMTIVIRLVLYPLTLQQLKSSKATQKIQPQVAEIRKKYKDPREQQEKLSALYKESGVNPMAGCLPLLIQLPVLYSFYGALRLVLGDPVAHHPGLYEPVLHNLMHTGINDLIYPFLPQFAIVPDTNLNWFTFLSPAWHISLGTPDPTHVLPILAGLVTFVQLRMSQPSTTINSKDPMTQQMQMMQFMMPLITVFIGWSLPAGLAVYWIATSIFGAVQQYFVTGWGSLFTSINIAGLLGGNTSNTGKASNNSGGKQRYNGDQRKESQLLGKADEPEAEVMTSSGPVGRNLRTTSHANGSSPGRRRSRGSSSSARRRGNTSNKSRR